VGRSHSRQKNGMFRRFNDAMRCGVILFDWEHRQVSDLTKYDLNVQREGANTRARESIRPENGKMTTIENRPYVRLRCRSFGWSKEDSKTEASKSSVLLLSLRLGVW